MAMGLGDYLNNAIAGAVGIGILLLVLGGCTVACDAIVDIAGGIAQSVSRPSDDAREASAFSIAPAQAGGEAAGVSAPGETPAE